MQSKNGTKFLQFSSQGVVNRTCHNMLEEQHDIGDFEKKKKFSENDRAFMPVYTAYGENEQRSRRDLLLSLAQERIIAHPQSIPTVCGLKG
jgi:hypothetical protein